MLYYIDSHMNGNVTVCSFEMVKNFFFAFRKTQ